MRRIMAKGRDDDISVVHYALHIKLRFVKLYSRRKVLRDVSVHKKRTVGEHSSSVNCPLVYDVTSGPDIKGSC